MIIFIQARYNSSRLPGKVLKNIKGRPILIWLIENLLNSKIVLPIVVLTSDKETDDPIVSFCKKRNIKYFRGDLCDVSSRFLKASIHYNQTHFVRLSADSPLFDPCILKEALSIANKNPNYDLITNVQKRTFPKGQSVEIVRFKALERLIKDGLTTYEKEHVTAGFYNRKKEYLIYNFVSNNTNYKDVQLSVDTKEDFLVIKSIFQEVLNTNKEVIVGWEEMSYIYNRIKKISN